MGIQMGGKWAPEFGGGPIDTEVEVLAHSEEKYVVAGPAFTGTTHDLGHCVAVRVQGTTIDVLLTEKNCQVLCTDFFDKKGIDLSSKRCIALKSMQHFRAAYTPIASKIVL